jgi:hypothetical protein
MVKTTRQQREALFKVFQRSFPRWVTPTLRIRPGFEVPTWRAATLNEWRDYAKRNPDAFVHVPSIQYRKFRKTVQPYFGDTCVMVPYAGMWLGIETDGYTHS